MEFDGNWQQKLSGIFFFETDFPFSETFFEAENHCPYLIRSVTDVVSCTVFFVPDIGAEHTATK